MTLCPATSREISKDPGYCRLKDYLIASTGLAYYRDRDLYLAAVIDRRLSKLGLHDCASYSGHLADGEAGRDELDALIASLTIGETYFFRDPKQFDAIRDIVIPEILERKHASRELRIWSAGCANGAEPYSLAILLAREMGHRLAGWQVSILATDINRRSLSEAREGKFQEWALRATPGDVKRGCFFNDGQGWTLHPKYKRWTSFAHMNLVEGEFPWLQNGIAGFDLILCRNVMIYFASDVNRRLIRQFHDSLADGGWFLPGAVEHSMESLSSFDVVNAAGATLYRKSLPEALRETVPSPAPELPEAVAPTAPPQRFERPNGEVLRRLADRGEWENAVSYCHKLLAQDRLNPVVYFYQALVLQHLGVRTEAEQSLRQAIYLDRNFLLAHYHLGLALKQGNQRRTAARCFENVLRLVTGLCDEQAVEHGDGVTVAGLKQMAITHLRNPGAL